MIHNIKAFCLMACAAALLSIILRTLSPDRLRRQIEMVVNLFLLICLLSPLSNLSFSANLPPSVDLAQTSPKISTDALFEQEVNRRLHAAVRENLEQNGIIPTEIRIDITVTENQVTLDSAAIFLREEDEKYSQRAQALAEQMLGTKVLVSIGQEVK